MNLAQPSSLGRYQIRRELGRGMMGVVYEAHDPALGRDVALKVIQLAFATDADARRSFEARFLSEARTAARLAHAGIVTVHDVGRDPDSGAVFMALELLRGVPLEARLREGPLPWGEALRIAQAVAQALHHAHALGVVHRDVKPANIMLLPSGEPKIMDFGIAKLDASQLTASGQFLGTPLYMSPEQAMAHPVDARSDIFSLGSVLYEMLTGRQAFAGESVTQVLFKVMSKEPEPVAGLVAGVPPAVEYVLARCLAKDVSRRYPDGRALADDIADVLAGRPPRGQAGWQPGPSPGGTLVAAAPTPVPAPPARTTVGARAAPQGAAPSGSRRTTLAVAAAAALAALVGGVAWLRNSAPETVARRVTVGPTPEPLPPGLPANTLPPADKPAAVPAQGFARLLIDFEHSLKSGLLRVWVDDQQVLEEPIGARVTREVAGIRFRKGRLSEALEVAAGRREIRVQVNWDDGTKTESAFANFKAGATRRLRVKFTNLAGLKRDLSLDWE